MPKRGWSSANCAGSGAEPQGADTCAQRYRHGFNCRLAIPVLAVPVWNEPGSASASRSLSGHDGLIRLPSGGNRALPQCGFLGLYPELERNGTGLLLVKHCRSRARG